MHFGLSEEQRLLQATLREFAAKELPPARLRQLFDAGSGWDAPLWRAAAGVGVQGMVIPERYGGAGLELLDLALAFEVLGEAAMPGPFLGHVLATLALVHGGSEAQRERWLPALAAGDAVASFALAEPGDVWEPAACGVRRTPDGVEGTKVFVDGAAQADLFVVAAERGELALVEAAASGVAVEPHDVLDRTRALGQVAFMAAPAEALPSGNQVTDAVLDAGRTLLAADAFGAAWRLIHMTVEYALTREQFGTPLAQFQGVKHQLANLAAETEPMRGLFWYAGYAFDHLPDERAHAAAVAKAHITDRAVQVGRAAVELHGGIGFTWDCDVQFWVKRTMFARTWLGSPQAHRTRIAALGGW